MRSFTHTQVTNILKAGYLKKKKKWTDGRRTEEEGKQKSRNKECVGVNTKGMRQRRRDKGKGKGEERGNCSRRKKRAKRSTRGNVRSSRVTCGPATVNEVRAGRTPWPALPWPLVLCPCGHEGAAVRAADKGSAPRNDTLFAFQKNVQRQAVDPTPPEGCVASSSRKGKSAEVIGTYFANLASRKKREGWSLRAPAFLRSLILRPSRPPSTMAVMDLPRCHFVTKIFLHPYPFYISFHFLIFRVGSSN